MEAAANHLVEELSARATAGLKPLIEADFETISRAMDIESTLLKAELEGLGVKFSNELPPTISVGIATPVRAEPESTPSAPPIEVTCTNCGSTYNDDFAYCPACGSETTRDPTQSHERRIAALEEQVRSLNEQQATTWRWIDAGENEKWKVWWGVWWRGVVISVALYFLVYFIAFASNP